MNTIPASEIVNVRPNVLSAGGTALDIIGLFLSTSSRVPIGTVEPFATAADVADFFGPVSDEAAAANIYFGGFDGSSVTPDSLLFAQYNTTAVSPYLRGGDISNLTVAQLQALSGSLSILVNAATFTNASVNLSAATSPSSTATIIQTALNAAVPTEASFTGAIAATTLTASAVTGPIIPGQTVGGAGVTSNTKIVSQLSGPAGGAGTYQVSISQSAASTAMTGKSSVTVTYDSQSGGLIVAGVTTGPLSTIGFATGTLAAAILFTSAAGAVLSQGAAAAVPGSFMDNVVSITQNWVTFATLFDPDASGNTLKLAFAAWTDAQNEQFAYACWDTDASPKTQVPATTSLGYLLAQAAYSGTFLISAPDYSKAAFACGIGASIDFTRTNGRTTYKFRTQGGLVPDVTNASVASNLAANGYNFFGVYATRSQAFNILAEGSVSGRFVWMDTYINQIQLNNALQQAILVGMTQNKSIPYNAKGYALIEAFCMDPINSALNFGSIQPGVTLSAAQTQEVNQAAGAVVAPTLQTRGWYLQVKDATPQVRANRQSPPCTLWYMDGGSVHKINLDSIAVQ